MDERALKLATIFASGIAFGLFASFLAGIIKASGQWAPGLLMGCLLLVFVYVAYDNGKDLLQ